MYLIRILPAELRFVKKFVKRTYWKNGDGKAGGESEACIRSILGRANADDGHEAAALGTFLAVAEEEVAAAGGAQIADEDVCSAKAGAKELRAIGFL